MPSQRGNPLRWNVYFKACPTSELPLAITVGRDESNNQWQTWQRGQNNPGQATQPYEHYVLDRHNLPEDIEFIRWASWQTYQDESLPFQSALDVLIGTYAQEEHSFLPCVGFMPTSSETYIYTNTLLAFTCSPGPWHEVYV